MNPKKKSLNRAVEDSTKMHQIARGNSPEVTIKRMQKVKERIAKFRETLDNFKQFSD